jgi:hypothetical protein
VGTHALTSGAAGATWRGNSARVTHTTCNGRTVHTARADCPWWNWAVTEDDSDLLHYNHLATYDAGRRRFFQQQMQVLMVPHQLTNPSRNSIWLRSLILPVEWVLSSLVVLARSVLEARLVPNAVVAPTRWRSQGRLGALYLIAASRASSPSVGPRGPLRMLDLS